MLQARAAYVWSHSIDNASSDSPTAYYIPGGNANIDRASSDFDVRHSVSGALTYAIPAVPGGGTVLRALLRGWYLDALLVAHTPTPVNIFVGADLLATGSASVARPNLVPGVPLYLSDSHAPGGQRYNRAAFSTPPSGVQGTLGRNAMEGFNVFQLDSSVRREVHIGERVSIQLRGEVFNLMNHPIRRVLQVPPQAPPWAVFDVYPFVPFRIRVAKCGWRDAILPGKSERRGRNKQQGKPAQFSCEPRSCFRWFASRRRRP